MQTGMFSTVRRRDERTDRYEAQIRLADGQSLSFKQQDVLLSVKEIAQALGVSAHSFDVRGDIPAYRISKMLRFDLARVQRVFLAKGLSPIVRPRPARPPANAGGTHRRTAPVR